MMEYGVTCGHTRFCDRPRGHEGKHGAWVETTAITELRVRVQALEEALRRTWSRQDEMDRFYCGVCDANADHRAENVHDPDCLVPSIYTETVTQG